jgi:hypothetical protein
MKKGNRTNELVCCISSTEPSLRHVAKPNCNSLVPTTTVTIFSSESAGPPSGDLTLSSISTHGISIQLEDRASASTVWKGEMVANSFGRRTRPCPGSWRLRFAQYRVQCRVDGLMPQSTVGQPQPDCGASHCRGLTYPRSRCERSLEQKSGGAAVQVKRLTLWANWV